MQPFLKDQDLDGIRSLETEMGKTVLAFSCHSAAPAKLDEPDLAKIQGLENDPGLSLVAVD